MSVYRLSRVCTTTSATRSQGRRVGGSREVERVLRRLRGHASHAYNRVVSCVTGDICREVIQDPALDDMWEAARLDKGYQSVAMTVKKKTGEDVQNTVQGSNQGVTGAGNRENVSD